MKTLIFADVHLKVDAANRDTLEDFVRFLREIDPAEFERVIILGDLFDFWFEYRHVVFSGYFDVLRALADLADRGIELHLVCGNHDFWAGRFFRDQLGFHVHTDAYRCQLGDKRALFVHGDGVNPSDVTYRAYKRLARSRAATLLFGLLHPDWAMAIARRVSHTSRRLAGPVDPARSREVAAIRDYACNLIAAGDADLVFCGHTHHPVEEEVVGPNGPGMYVNTGGWLEHRTYLVWDGANVERFSGPLTHRNSDPSEIEEGKRVALSPVNVARQKADQAQ